MLSISRKLVRISVPIESIAAANRNDLSPSLSQGSPASLRHQAPRPSDLCRIPKQLCANPALMSAICYAAMNKPRLLIIRRYGGCGLGRNKKGRGEDKPTRKRGRENRLDPERNENQVRGGHREEISFPGQERDGRFLMETGSGRPVPIFCLFIRDLLDFKQTARELPRL